MNKIELEIVALSHSVTKSHNYAVVLGETEGDRRLPIVIGGFEAQAIAVAMESMSPNRPLTHDLFKNTLSAFNINLREVLINNLLDGIFYAQLVCEQNGEEFLVDSRTSDAIALAVRFNSKIYTYEFILDQAGVVFDGDEDIAPLESKKRTTPKKEKPLAEHKVADLEAMLEKFLEDENYEKAALIRDELKKRENPS